MYIILGSNSFVDNILQKSATEFCIFKNVPYLCIVRNDRRVADWCPKDYINKSLTPADISEWMRKDPLKTDVQRARLEM
jgi:hypothetical protein